MRRFWPGSARSGAPGLPQLEAPRPSRGVSGRFARLGIFPGPFLKADFLFRQNEKRFAPFLSCPGHFGGPRKVPAPTIRFSVEDDGP